MRERHFPQAQNVIGLLAGGVSESVGRPNRNDERRGISLLTLAKESRQVFGGELFASRIEQHKASFCSATIASTQLQQRGFVFERNAFDFGVLAQSLHIL